MLPSTRQLWTRVGSHLVVGGLCLVLLILPQRLQYAGLVAILINTACYQLSYRHTFVPVTLMAACSAANYMVSPAERNEMDHSR
jgi:hypothetical protein